MRQHSGLANSSSPADGFSHDLLVHDGDDELITATRAFVEQGLAAGGTVLVVGSRQRVTMMHDVLGTHPQLEYGLEDDLYQEPTRTLFAFQRRLAHHPENVSVTGTVPFVRDPGKHSGWGRYESVVNEALSTYPFHALCTYDTRTLPASVIAVARATHPTINTGQTSSRNTDYHDPEAFLAHPLARVPKPPRSPPSIIATVTDFADLAAARHLVKNSALASSTLPPQAVEEFLIAVNEAMANGLLHGAPPIHLAHWVELTTLTCHVVDSGGALPRLTGYRRPDESGPLGLWSARQLVDDLIISNTPQGGASVLLTKT